MLSASACTAVSYVDPQRARRCTSGLLVMMRQPFTIAAPSSSRHIAVGTPGVPKRPHSSSLYSSSMSSFRTTLTSVTYSKHSRTMTDVSERGDHATLSLPSPHPPIAHPSSACTRRAFGPSPGHLSHTPHARGLELLIGGRPTLRVGAPRPRCAPHSSQQPGPHAIRNQIKGETFDQEKGRQTVLDTS